MSNSNHKPSPHGGAGGGPKCSRNIAIVLAGGSGRRMGTDVPKQYLEIRGRMVIEYAIDAFDRNANIDEVAVVVSADNVDTMRDIAAHNNWKKLRHILVGGKERYDSSLAAINAYRDEDCNIIFHDAARPLVTQRIIDDVVDKLRTCQAVGVAQPSVDTILVIEDGCIKSVPDRSTLRRAQTPQGFDISIIRNAYEIGLQDPDFKATDDCGIVLRYRPDIPVHIVDGDEACMKITYKSDCQILETFL